MELTRTQIKQLKYLDNIFEYAVKYDFDKNTCAVFDLQEKEYKNINTISDWLNFYINIYKTRINDYKDDYIITSPWLEILSNLTSVYFSDIPVGNTFNYNGTAYLKINDFWKASNCTSNAVIDNYNCVNLVTFEVAAFGSDYEVNYNSEV